MNIVCAFCGCTEDKPTGAVRRAQAIGAPLFCGMACFRASRRMNRSTFQKKEIKREYDARRRVEKAAEIKAYKAAHFQATYDPAKAAIERKARMPRHVEYCRQPAYRAKKTEYDRQRRARLQFGEFGPAALVLQIVENEVAKRASKYDIGLMNGTINKAQLRRRAL